MLATPVDGLQAFLWLDASNHTTTGTGPYKVTPSPSFQVSSTIGKGANGTNETLVYQVDAQRHLSFTSTLNTSRGSRQVSWQQSLTYSNFGNLTDAGNVQINNQNTNGVDASGSGYSRSINYPLYVYSAYATIGDNISIIADINRGKDVQTIGQPVFPTGLEAFSAAEDVHSEYPLFQGASLSTTQNGSATYLANETSSTSFSFGTTEQDMVFAGIRIGSGKNAQGFPSIASSDELFHRHVLAVNSTVVEDEETLVDTAIEHIHGPPGNGKGFAANGVQGMLGRGPKGPGNAAQP